MGIRATLEHLLVRISSFHSRENRANAGQDDQEGFFHLGSGERKFVASSTLKIRSHGSSTRTPSNVIVGPSSRVFSPSSPSPTTTTSLLDIAAERVEAHYDINHIYHYLATVESDLIQQTRLTTDQSIQEWQDHADIYLPELIRLEGRGDFISNVCCGCRDTLGEGLGLRCDDCQDQALYCLPCCVANHSRHPLHRIRRWTGSQFEPVQLSLLGLRFQLGHPIGEECPSPDVSLSGSIIVLDLSGFHQVRIAFCSCQKALPPFVQLLRQGWFPAACVAPRSAATFRLLEHFLILSSRSKISALSYYLSLLCASSHTELIPPMNQLPAFLVMIREWQLLKTLKRAGAGSKARIAASRRDSHFVQCLVCSSRNDHPPDANVGVSPKTSWLRRLSLIAHMNKVPFFRSQDPALRKEGITYNHGVMHPSWVIGTVQENRDTLDPPCRSSVLLPANAHHSYADQPRDLPPLPQLGLGGDVQARVTPIPDLLQETATTDIGRALTCPGYEESHIHAPESWNWDMVTTLPMTLLLDAERALSQRHIYDNLYSALNDLVPLEHVKLWTLIALRWEMDGGEGENGPNPFEFHHSLLGQKKVRADLHREDLVAIQSGKGKFVGAEEDTASTIIATGLDLEEQQLQLAATIADLQPQSNGLREVGIIAEQGRLRRRIEAWLDIAQILVPVIASSRVRYAAIADTVSAQDLPLYLPSTLHSAKDVDECLFSHEWRLREAQAYDALAHLRAHLKVIAYLRSSTYKNPDAEQKANLVADVVRAKICIDVRRYRAAYAALVALAPVLGHAMEEGYLQELEDSDVWYISTVNGVSTPWIWWFGRTALLDPACVLNLDVNKDLNAALRVEWYDARAHARTSMQMCKSLRDEMRRTIASHEQRAYWWETQIGGNFADRADYREGADSYASRQASIRRAMKDHCTALWASIKDCLSTGPYDLPDYPGATSSSSG